MLRLSVGLDLSSVLGPVILIPFSDVLQCSVCAVKQYTSTSFHVFHNSSFSDQFHNSTPLNQRIRKEVIKRPKVKFRHSPVVMAASIKKLLNFMINLTNVFIPFTCDISDSTQKI
jgi:hypothetical protein